MKRDRTKDGIPYFAALKAQLEELGFALQDEYIEAAQGGLDLPYPAFMLDAHAGGMSLVGGVGVLELFSDLAWQEFVGVYDEILSLCVRKAKQSERTAGRPMTNILTGIRHNIRKQLSNVVAPLGTYAGEHDFSVSVAYRAAEIAYAVWLSDPDGPDQIELGPNTFYIARRDSVFGVYEGRVMDRNGDMLYEQEDFDTQLLLVPRKVPGLLPDDCLTWGAMAKFVEQLDPQQPELYQMLCSLRYKYGRAFDYSTSVDTLTKRRLRPIRKLNARGRGRTKLSDLERSTRISIAIGAAEMNPGMTLMQIRRKIGAALTDDQYKEVVGKYTQSKNDRFRYFEALRQLRDTLRNAYETQQSD